MSVYSGERAEQALCESEAKFAEPSHMLTSALPLLKMLVFD